MEKLNHFIWSCTRAYETKDAYSLGDGKPLRNELTTNEAIMLIDKAVQFGVESFFISGAGLTGEPILRKDFLEIIHYAAERGLAPYVKTSGWRFNRNTAKELASCNCNVVISFAGLKETDVQLRGKGAFERSINAAKFCVEEGIKPSMSVVSTKYVVNQIPDLIKLCLDMGAQSFTLASLIPQPIFAEEQLRILGPLEPTPFERENELNEMYNISKEVGNKMLILPYEIFYNRILKNREPSLQLRTRCSVCNNIETNEWIDVLDDGKAYGCSPLGLMFGDIRKDSIEEIVSRMRASDSIKKLADRNNIKGKCGICEYKSICGGCRARAYIYTGDMLNNDPACSYEPRRKQKAVN